MSTVTTQKDKEYYVTVEGKQYSVILHPDNKDGGYWIECPSLPGCASQGDTVKEALEMISDAIEGHLEVLA
jgi:antitoxin HicB